MHSSSRNDMSIMSWNFGSSFLYFSSILSNTLGAIPESVMALTKSLFVIRFFRPLSVSAISSVSFGFAIETFRRSYAGVSNLTKRIDRTSDGSKIPMEDMCQLTERLTEYKYKGSYEQIAKHIKKYSAVPQLDLVNYWEVVVFSWITGNSDMHLKNFSLYKSPMGYCLTPAYDLLSTAIVMPEDKEELALTLNGKKARIRRSDFEKSIIASGVNEKVLDNIAKKFRKALMKWIELIEASFLPDDFKRQYKRLILKRMLMLR